MATATPITPGLLATYSVRLRYECQFPNHSYIESNSPFIQAVNPAFRFHFPRGIDAEDDAGTRRSAPVSSSRRQAA